MNTRNRWRQRAALLLPWAFALLLLWWSLHSISLHELLVYLGKLSVPGLAPLLLANAGIVLLLPARWYLLLRCQGYALPYSALTRYRLAAFGISYLTPGPQFGGEPLQVLLAERNHGVPREIALAAVALDKALELFVNFGILLMGSIVVVRQAIIVDLDGERLLLLTSTLFSFPLLYLLLLSRDNRPLAVFLGAIGWLTGDRLRVVRAARQQVESAEKHAAALPLPALLGAFLFSLTSWLALSAEFWLMFALLGVPLSPVQLVILLTATRLGQLLPLPAGVGTMEAGLIFALELQGLPAAAGLGAAMLIRTRDLALAAAGLWRIGHFSGTLESRS